MEQKAKIVSEINAERINIVDPDGTPRLSLFNGENIPPAIIDGLDIASGHRQGENWAGMMFFNTQGDECGGLIFNGDEDDEGNRGLEIRIDDADQVSARIFDHDGDETDLLTPQ